jgi:hypothetical protein
MARREAEHSHVFAELAFRSLRKCNMVPGGKPVNAIERIGSTDRICE